MRLILMKYSCNTLYNTYNNNNLFCKVHLFGCRNYYTYHTLLFSQIVLNFEQYIIMNLSIYIREPHLKSTIYFAIYALLLTQLTLAGTMGCLYIYFTPRQAILLRRPGDFTPATRRFYSGGQAILLWLKPDDFTPAKARRFYVHMQGYP